jgi:beta-lactamase superfamily II metal-dependent hydrolase
VNSSRRIPTLGSVLVLGFALLAWSTPSSAQLFSRRSGARLGAASASASIEVLDVGQGDSILIRSPEGKTALVDAGPSRDASAKALEARGVHAIDLVVVSHHHSDHYGGMERIVSDFRPRYFVASDSEHSTTLFLRLLKSVQSEGMAVVRPTTKPRRIELGSVEITIFPQPPEDSAEENNNSIGLRVRYGEFDALLTGDSEESERAWWLRNCPDLVRNCELLKLAHHGSRNGIDADWLRTVRPSLAVASLGQGNSFGHPHSETVSLLSRARIPLLRTDQLGTIVIETDGRNWGVVRPSLARDGHPTQADVDRVASAGRNDDAPPARSRRPRSTTSPSIRLR